MAPASAAVAPPLVTVTICCYEQAHFLHDAIDSVAAQTYRPYEVVVVDDGSTDETKQVVRRYPWVRYIRQPHLGLATARNRGLDASGGEYVVLLDADDRLLPEHLALGVAAFAEHPEAAIVCGDYRIFGSGETAHVHRCQPDPDSFATLLSAGGFPGPPGASMLRRRVVLSLGGVRTRFAANGDYDLFLRIAQRHPLYCHHQVVLEYRRHDEQRTRNYALMLQTVMAVLRDQGPYVRRHPEYAHAYRLAHERFRQSYGECLLWQVVAGVRERRLRQAARDLVVLLRWYPQGLWRLFRRRLGRRRISASSSPS